MRKHLNEIDTIGEIRQARRHPTGKNYLWILVEGISDQKLYSKLIDGPYTKIEIVHGGGKNELRDALLKLIVETNRVIGIRDADFLRLDKQQETIKTLFLTDAHDAEMMLLSCDEAFHHVVAEYLPAKRTESNTLRNSLLISLVFFSGIRWLNNTEDLGLNFKGIGLTDFYDAINLTLKKNECIQVVEIRSPNKKRTIEVEEIDLKITGNSDYYNLCNGHDILKAFALHITAKGGRGIKDDEISNALRVAYRKEDFAATALFKSLKNWEYDTGYSLFAV
jgi:hypothetical protein